MKLQFEDSRVILEKGCEADVVFSFGFLSKASSLLSQLGDCPAPIRVRVLSQRWASPGRSALTNSDTPAINLKPGDAIAGRWQDLSSGESSTVTYDQPSMPSHVRCWQKLEHYPC